MRADHADDDVSREGASTRGGGLDEQDQAATPYGRYRWDVRLDRWAWSEGMFRLHGYPGPVITPTTALLLDHKDPDGRGRATSIVERARREMSSYVNHHRIVDTHGRTRTVLSIGSSVFTADGELVAAGFMVDLTDVERAASSAAVAAATEGRIAIAQAQGAVMAVFGLSDDAALAMLVWYSQTYHVKLNSLCRALVADLARNEPVTHHEQLTTLILRTIEARVGETGEAISSST